MDDLPQVTLTEGLWSYARLKLAAGTVPFLLGPAGEHLEGWLRSLFTPDDLIVDRLLDVEVALAADLTRVTCQAAGAAPGIRRRMKAFLADYEFSESEIWRLEEIVERVRPAQVGSWIELAEEGLDTGWYLPGPIALSPALAAADPSPDRDQFAAWAGEQGIQTFRRVGRSLAEDWASTELRLALPQAGIEQGLQAVLDLFGRLSLPLPSDTALAAMLHLGQGALGLAIGLDGESVTRLGLLLSDPNSELMLRLCRAAGINQDEALATFEGYLGVEGCSTIEYQLLAEGFGVELGYRPAGAPGRSGA
jgi:hypothetical protein